jgi:YihY family inner membrane protein
VNLSALKDRVNSFQRGHRPASFIYAVYKKFQADSSGSLAVLITYYTFFSIFPLLLALESVLGLVLHDHPSWQMKIESGALNNFKQFPLVKGPTPQHGSVLLVVIGSLVALYSGLAVAKTASNVWDLVYRVPKTERPGFVPKNLRALRLVLVGGLGLILTTIISGSIAGGGSLGLHIGGGLSVLGYLVTLILNTLLFTVVFSWLTVRPVSMRDALPGAAISAVSLVILQSVATALLTHQLANARAQYGAAGGVLVLLSWFYLQSQVLLFAAQVNVVKQDRLWPRSLDEPVDDADEWGL